MVKQKINGGKKKKKIVVGRALHKKLGKLKIFKSTNTRG